MKLEDIVCSVELSKKLSSLGVKRKSLFVWRKWANYSEDKKEPSWKVCQRKGSLNVYDTYPAFTGDELANMLPASLHGVESEVIKFSHAGEKPKYSARYIPLRIVPDIDEKMSNAIAKTIIYLIENKLAEIV